MTRRHVLRSAGLLGLTTLAGQAAADEKGKAGGGFADAGKVELVTPDVLKPKTFSADVSPDGEALTLLFSDLLVALPGEADKSLSAVKVATLRIPFTLPEKQGLAGFIGDISGFVQKGAGARAVLIADMGGTARVFEFPYGEDLSGGKDYVQEMFSLERRVVTGGGSGPPVPPYTMNLFLAVQRRTKDDLVMLIVDAIDVSTVYDYPGASKREKAPRKKPERPKFGSPG
jgi:hypothetical protein